jgi:hypothetical protein
MEEKTSISVTYEGLSKLKRGLASVEDAECLWHCFSTLMEFFVKI